MAFSGLILSMGACISRVQDHKSIVSAEENKFNALVGPGAIPVAGGAIAHGSS